jgi:uncharacterized protein (DUF488 family)
LQVGIYTIGHSTLPIDEFVEVLRAHGVDMVVDVRTVAKSRHNPQYGSEQLAASLREAGIGYVRLESLGGFRRTDPNSINTAWRNASFRGYADYMQTPEFWAGIEELLALTADTTVAIMCAEAVPWRCHRSLIGDALLVKGYEVGDIMNAKTVKPHRLTAFARVEAGRITYPG